MPQEQFERPQATALENGADVAFQNGSGALLSMEVVEALRLVRSAYGDKVKSREQILLEYIIVIGNNLISMRRNELGETNDTPKPAAADRNAKVIQLSGHRPKQPGEYQIPEQKAA